MIPFGTPRRHVAQCGSTNDLAREWARDPDDPAPSGALVTADFQTRGRGQRGRQWQAGWGQSALMSFVYHLPPSVQAGQLGLVVALAVADALASLADLEARLKWPNDILLDGHKAVGILVEISPPTPATVDEEGAVKKEPLPATPIKPRSSPPSPEGRGKEEEITAIHFPCPPVSGGPPLAAGWVLTPPELGVGGRSFPQLGSAVLGIGINVNQERFVGAQEFVYPPTSLRLETGHALDVERVIGAVAQALTRREETWRRDGFAPIIQECQSRLAVGAAVRRGEQSAELMGLNYDGSALVRMADGTFAAWSTVD